MIEKEFIKLIDNKDLYCISKDFHYYLRKYALPNSNLGVHSISYKADINEINEQIKNLDLDKKCNSILNDGLYKSLNYAHLGLANTIKFCNKLENPDSAKNIIEWMFGNLYFTNNIKIIIAIPDEITFDNNTYYIDYIPNSKDYNCKYTSNKYYEIIKNIKFNQIPKLPKEFIIGYLKYDIIEPNNLEKGCFIFCNHRLYLNKNYISFIDPNSISDENKNLIIEYSHQSEKTRKKL